MSFIPSKYQLAVKDWLLNGEGNAIIEAVPGSGKTTTLVWLVQYVAGISLAFFSFCKSIVLTIKAKCPSADCSTYNSLGFRAIVKHLGIPFSKVKLHGARNRWGQKVPNKAMCILWDMFPKNGEGERPKEYFAYKDFVCRLVGLAKNEGIGCLVPELCQWERLVAYHNLELTQASAKLERAIEISRDVLTTSNRWSLEGKLDFDDQKYLVSLWDLSLKTFRLIFIDEAQDTNGIERDMLRRMCDADTRILIVGDAKQGIYGFRGADCNAMDLLREAFNATSLKLSINYRCAKAIVERANEIFPEVGMESAPDVPLGKVETLDEYDKQAFVSTDAIICRNTAPLVKQAYQFIRAMIACHVLGKEIGEGLIELVGKLNADSIDDMLESLSEYQLRETDRLTKSGKASQAENINDQCDCIRLFVDNLQETNRTIDQLKANINALFDPTNDKGITLCTIHKAKGMEWERVFILDFHLIPSKYAIQDHQLEQEKNLQWVALTRAMREEYFITSEGWMGETGSTGGNGRDLDAESEVIQLESECS